MCGAGSPWEDHVSVGWEAEVGCSEDLLFSALFCVPLCFPEWWSTEVVYTVCLLMIVV